MTEKKSLEDKVYEKLKDAIIQKKFPINYKLIENEIAETLKVSRTPVHTALKLLEKDGLLAIIPNKGAFVTKKTYKEVEEAFKVRSELEKMSIRLAIKNITDNDIKELEKILDQESDAYKKKNRSKAYDFGSEFHIKIAKIAGNRFLKEYIEDIIVKTGVYDLIYILNDPNLERKYFTPTQHYEILEALKERDVKKAEKVIQAHILTTEKQLNLAYEEAEDPLKSLAE